jgi:hypothetical protein
LNWSADLAKNAADWVKACHTKKDSNGNDFFCHQSIPTPQNPGGCGTDPSYHYGENLYFGYPTASGKKAVDEWYCEISAYLADPGVRGGTVFGSACDSNPDKVTGHFTQVVWRGSSKLGCAQNTCTLGPKPPATQQLTGTLWACEYDPQGNFNADLPGVLDQNVPKPLQGFAHAANIPESSAPQRTTAIISDVDLYNIPGGTGKVIGILRQGQEFPLIGCRADPAGAPTADNNWCQVSKGWVWGSFIMRNHSR